MFELNPANAELKNQKLTNENEYFNNVQLKSKSLILYLRDIFSSFLELLN